MQTPGAVRSVPAAQPPVATQLDWFAVVVVVPGAHEAHCRSDVALPGVLTYVPGLHMLHTAHVAAFIVVLKLPLVQLLQERSVRVVPSVATCCPAMHDDQPTHAVAGLASSSHVPAAQAWLGAVPPAQ